MCPVCCVCVEISKIIEVVVTATDRSMVVSSPAVNVTPTAVTGKIVTEMVLVIMADVISFCRKTTTIAFIMLEFENVLVMMHRHRNTADTQMTGSCVTELTAGNCHRAIRLQLVVVKGLIISVIVSI